MELSGRERDEIAIEAGIQLIPVIGGALAALYYGRKQEIRFKRLENFYKEFADESMKFKANLLPVESHDRECLLAILEEFNEKIEREHITEKKVYFKNFLKNSLINTINESNFDQQKFFLDVLSQMTLLECGLIFSLGNIKDGERIPVSGIKIEGLDQYVIVGAISRLRAYGFVESIQDRVVFGADVLLSECVKLSQFGKAFKYFCIS